MEQNDLYKELKEYSKSDVYPFHMPGHKRNVKLLGDCLPYDIDITEIHGFDDLHEAEGILKAVQDKAAEVFHSERSYMLINGSTCGILAAVFSAVKYGDSVIMARNCHKSVYNACMINNLKMNFIYPEQDEMSGVFSSVTPDSVLSALKEAVQTAAVIVTSPTYEGVISDIKAIADICHGFGVPLIVDNAHGSHQGFFECMKGEPVSSGADIVISSLHKTLPSLTQTAIAHLNGKFISHESFEKALSVFETSSPSYVLMASVDRCLDFLKESEELFYRYRKRLICFSAKMSKLKKLRILCHGNDTIDNHSFFDFDIGKIVICTVKTNIGGYELMCLLREKYGLELEMAYPTYTLAMTSVCDTDEGFNRLADALTEIDGFLSESFDKKAILSVPRLNSSGKSIRDALEMSKSTALQNGISRSYVYAYPPGVPVIIPGEIPNEYAKKYIETLIESGIRVIES